MCNIVRLPVNLLIILTHAGRNTMPKATLLIVVTKKLNFRTITTLRTQSIIIKA